MYGPGYKLIAIGFSLTMLLQAYVIRKRVGTFLFPAALFSLAWFFYTIIPLILLFSVPINPVAIGYISLCTLAFTLSSWPFDWNGAFAKNREKCGEEVDMFDSRLINGCFFASFIFAFLFSTLNMLRNGFALKDLTLNLRQTSALYAASRGEGKLGYGVFGVLGYLFTNITPVFGTFVFAAKKSKYGRVAILLSSFLPALFCMLTQSSKIIMLTSVLFSLSVFCLIKIFKNDFCLFGKGVLLKLLVSSVVVLFLICFSLLTRQGYNNYADTSDMLIRLAHGLNSYLLGQIYAFADFFSYYINMGATQAYKNDFNSLGYYTFKSVFDCLGGTKFFPIGYYDENYIYPHPLIETNIFTIYRSLIYDFGGFGATVYFFVSGLFVHYFFRKLLLERSSWSACVIFMLFTIYAFMSYLFSIFTSRYVVFVGFVTLVVLYINDWWENRNRKGHIS